MGLARVVIVAMVVWMQPAHGAPCVDVAKGYEQQDAAKAAGEARFKKAIADRKLTSVALTKISLPGRQVGDTIAGDFKVDRAERADRQGAQVTVVTAIEGSCGYATPADFVQQGTKIYRADRKPKRGKTTKVETCGCAYPRGGCGQRMVARATGFVLPPGTTWGGVMPIEFTDDTIELTHAAACPPPQALP
jgi:hypothetical protein